MQQATLDRNIDATQIHSQAMVLETEAELEGICADIRDLIEINRAANALLQAHGEGLDKVEDAVEVANKDCEEAIFELAEAGRYQAKNKLLEYTAGGIAVGTAVGAGLGAIGGASGAAAGAATVAAIGGLVGNGIGKMISMYKNHVIDSVLIAHQNDNLKPNPKPLDGEAPPPPEKCEKCGVTFGVFTYSHLCRLCGDFFCTSCRDLKERVKYRGIDELKNVPVCDFCIPVYKAKPETFQTEEWITNKSWLKERQVIVDKYRQENQKDLV